MAATAAAPPATSPSGADGADPEDSNISSPLSEVGDKDTNDDINMHVDDGDEKASSLTAEEHQNTNQDSDSDSALSDARSVANTDDNDTEAETERLYDTPHNQRHRDVVVDQYNDGQIFEHTSSKLRSTAVIDHDDDHADDESLPGDGVSSASEKSEAAESPSKITTSKDTNVDDEYQHNSQDRKRKRSPATDNSDPEQPFPKRMGSVGAVEAEVDQEATADEEEIAATHDLSGSHFVVDEGDASPRKQEAAAEEIPTEPENRVTKKITRNGPKRQDSAVEDVDEEVAGEAQDEGQHNAVGEPEHHGEAPEAEAEEEAEAATKSAEEAERKQAAFKDWSRIEEMFGVFRDRLYKDRLQRLEEEEQSLLADEPTHPEYLNMKKCLDDRLNQKLREIEKEHELRMRANERRAVAVRAQIWSQYFQSAREKRESVLEALNKEWYDIQTTRRSAHSLPDYGILFPKDPTQRVKNAVAYNTEVSTLAGMAKYEGFPAGPDIKGASDSDLADDLNAIDRNRRAGQREGFQTQRLPGQEMPASAFHRLGPAGEQFLKDTPWANPNHSVHRILAHELNHNQLDGTAEQTAVVGRGTQPAPTSSTTTTVDGPISQQRSPAPSSRLSESPELARSALKSGNTMKRTGNLPNAGRGSKTAAA